MSERDTSHHAWMSGSALIELEPGPLPIIPKPMWTEIQEWILSWKHAEALCEAGMAAPGALLLYGPPGSGKTSLARAILKYMQGRPGCILEAHNTLSKMFSESASNVGRAFHLAERHEALIVIEEIDALGIARSGDTNSKEDNNVTIALMRCIEAAKIPVIATTNVKDHLDPALLRRFEMKLEVPTLDEKGRALVLKKILGREPEAELVALPLNDSIRLAHRMKRREFLAMLEGSK